MPTIKKSNYHSG